MHPCAVAQESVADRVVILKKQHQMMLLQHRHAFKTYSISLGRGGVEPKQRQGDHRTPEGLYTIDSRKRNSTFHWALHVSYPSDSDRQRASKLGVQPGSDIEIHGLPNGIGWLGWLHRLVDWTDGCVAVTNSEIEEIWGLVPVGTPVEIKS